MYAYMNFIHKYDIENNDRPVQLLTRYIKRLKKKIC